MDRIRSAWKLIKKVKHYPAWNVTRPILNLFSLEELEEVAMKMRVSRNDLPTAQLVEKQVAFNKLMTLQGEWNEYQRMDDIASELASKMRRPVDLELDATDVVNKLPVFASKVGLSVSRTWADLEIKCRFIFQKIWTWVCELKRNPLAVPLDMLVLNDAFKVACEGSMDLKPARFPPGAFVPVRGQGELIWVITSVFPTIEIVPVPEMISLQNKEDLTRSFKQFGRVSLAFGMPDKLEENVKKIKTFTPTEQDLIDNKDFVKAAYSDFFGHLTSYRQDETERVLVGLKISQGSDMQRAIADNLVGLLTVYGLEDPSVPASLIYAKWAEAFGAGKITIPDLRKPNPPQIAQISPFRASENPSELTPRTCLFDKRKKLVLASEHKNKCKSFGCTDFSSYLPLCEYHTMMYGDLVTSRHLASSVSSLRDVNTHSFAAERISVADSWNVVSPQIRARFLKEVVSQLQGRHNQNDFTPVEALWNMMLRYGCGVTDVSWGSSVLTRNKPLLDCLNELQRDFYKLKRSQNWVKVDDSGEGNLLVIELKSSVYARQRLYGRLALVGKADGDTIVERRAGDDHLDSHQDAPLRQVFDQTRYPEIRRQVDRLAKIPTGNMTPPELVYLRQLTADLGVKLAILVIYESEFKTTCNTFNFEEGNELNNHLAIITKSKTSAASTISFLEKTTSSGTCAALVPVARSPLLSCYPPSGGDNAQGWTYLADFVLASNPENSLAAENLIGTFFNDGVTQARSREREVMIFWFIRFLHFMGENELMHDVGISFGDIQVFSTARETIEPKAEILSSLSTIKLAEDDQKAQVRHQERVVEKTKDYPFTNDLIGYGERSLVADFEIPESKLRRMALVWNEMSFSVAGSLAPHEFKAMWTLQGVARTAFQQMAAAEKFDRRQVQLERRVLFEKESDLRRELRLRALREAELERDGSTNNEGCKDWWAPKVESEEDSTNAATEQAVEEIFPAVNNQPLQPVDLQVIQQEAPTLDEAQQAPLPAPTAEEDIYLGAGEDSGCFSSETIEPETSTPAGTVPDTSELDREVELTKEQKKRKKENARIEHYKAEMMAKTIRPGGRWDPKKLGVEENLAPENVKMGISILQALAEVRILADKIPNSEARLHQATDPTDVSIISELSKNLTSAKAAPDIIKLAKATKCTITEVANRVAQLNLGGVAYYQADKPISSSRDETVFSPNTMLDFDHRADMAPGPEARAVLAKMGVEYNNECLVAHSDIEITFDRETRILIKRAANLLSYDFNEAADDGSELLLANTAAAFLVELLLADPLGLTQYLACIAALDGTINSVKIRQAMYFNLMYTNRTGRVKKWAIHFLPYGQDEF